MSTEPTPEPSQGFELPERPPERRRVERRRVLATGLIVLLVFIVYWPALRGGFVWDDTLLVERNPLVKGDLGVHSLWFQTDFPLSLVAFWLQWLMWGSHPAGYHAVNVLLHAINALLVWRVLARLRIPGCWFAAVLFAAHPVCVASVAWVSELKNTLSLFLYLLSLRWYLGFEEAKEESPVHTPPSTVAGQEIASEVKQPAGRGQTFYWLSLATFVLALLAKTSTVMLPAVLLGCAWWQRGRVVRQDWLRAAPYFIFALTFGLLTIWFQSHQAMGGTAVQTESFWGRLAGAGFALWFYLGKALLPLNLNLIYPRWHLDAASPLSWLPLLLWFGLLGLCWRFRRGWGRHALFGLGCFTLNLFPVLGLFDMYFLALSRVSDHFLYLPLIAVLALAAAALKSLFFRLATYFAASRHSTNPTQLTLLTHLTCVTLLIVPLSILSFHRARIFASDEALWRDTLARNPAAWVAHNNLGSILAEQHKYEDAAAHFMTSLQLKPDNAQAHCNLGSLLALQGRFPEAESHFLAALKTKPNDADIHKAYASALSAQGKTLEALKHTRAAISLQPDPALRLSYASLLYQTGDFREAVAQYRQVLAAGAESPEPLNNLAWLLATCPDSAVRNGKEAVRLAERACRLSKFKEPSMLGVLAAAYAEAGRFNDAIGAAQQTISLATAAGNTRFAAMNQQLLQLYRAGKPYHEPPR